MRRIALLLAALGGVFPRTALAVDVTFTGLVADTCTISLATPGVMTLSSDGTILGTDQGGLGVPATVTVVSIGSNHLSLSPPTLESYPAGYSPGSETVEISYSGLASHPLFSALQLDLDIGLLALANLFVDLRITNPAGFSQGSYTAQTVLTCS
jgi:hypothetical protein